MTDELNETPEPEVMTLEDFSDLIRGLPMDPNNGITNANTGEAENECFEIPLNELQVIDGEGEGTDRITFAEMETQQVFVLEENREDLPLEPEPEPESQPEPELTQPEPETPAPLMTVPESETEMESSLSLPQVVESTVLAKTEAVVTEIQVEPSPLILAPADSSTENIPVIVISDESQINSESISLASESASAGQVQDVENDLPVTVTILDEEKDNIGIETTAEAISSDPVIVPAEEAVESVNESDVCKNLLLSFRLIFVYLQIRLITLVCSIM